MTHHSFVTMIEPFEPILIHPQRAISHAVEFDKIARHVLLPNNEWDAALSESAQRLVPSVLRCGIDDIIGLCRVEIVALDPHPGGRSQLARGGRHDLAQGCRNMVSGEELDHAMTVGV